MLIKDRQYRIVSPTPAITVTRQIYKLEPGCSVRFQGPAQDPRMVEVVWEAQTLVVFEEDFEERAEEELA